jgi:LysR family transcriptional regulator, hca operon transcriptional activator
MELRHLRYFVAVAEEGGLTVAAEKRLHTAQPSLSRQIRDLEYEVGVPLLSRSLHGVELTPAGCAFLDHARLALTQAEAAAEAARHAAQPAKQIFAMGFLTGQEADWLPHATRVLRDELSNIEIRISSDHSATLADDLQRGKLDVAFLRAEPTPDLEFKLVTKEPLVVVLPSDHRLAARAAVDPHDFIGETYIGISNVPRVLRAIISIISSARQSISCRLSRSTITPWPFRSSLRRAASRCCRRRPRISCRGRSLPARSWETARRSTSWSATTRPTHRRSCNGF